MSELFKKVYVRTEADLPKKTGHFIVQIKDWGADQSMFSPNDPDVVKEWLREIDWYLHPVESNPAHADNGIGEQDYAGNYDVTVKIPRKNGGKFTLHPSSETSKAEKCPCKDQTCFVDSDNDLLGCKYPSVEPSEQRTAEDKDTRKLLADLMLVVWKGGQKSIDPKEDIYQYSFQESVETDGSSTDPSEMTVKDVIDTLEQMMEEYRNSALPCRVRKKPN